MREKLYIAREKDSSRSFFPLFKFWSLLRVIRFFLWCMRTPWKATICWPRLHNLLAWQKTDKLARVMICVGHRPDNTACIRMYASIFLCFRDSRLILPYAFPLTSRSLREEWSWSERCNRWSCYAKWGNKLSHVSRMSSVDDSCQLVGIRNSQFAIQGRILSSRFFFFAHWILDLSKSKYHAL